MNGYEEKFKYDARRTFTQVFTPFCRELYAEAPECAHKVVELAKGVEYKKDVCIIDGILEKSDAESYVVEFSFYERENTQSILQFCGDIIKAKGEKEKNPKYGNLVYKDNEYILHFYKL